MPMMMAPVVAGLVGITYTNLWLVSLIMQSAGILGEKSILGDTGTAGGIVIVDVWQWTPLIILITLVARSKRSMEASMVDGAGQLFPNYPPESLSVFVDRNFATLYGQFPVY